jgi:hypothetical protein
VIRIASDGLAVRAVDDAHTRSVTATLDADACAEYAATPGRLAFDPTALRAAITADETVSAETAPVTLAYATGDSTLSVSLATVTHEQPIDPTPEPQVPRLREWLGGAMVRHRAEPLAAACDSFVAITEAVAVEYDGSRNTFRIESAAEQSADDASRATDSYERAGDDLPGEAPAATVRAA